MPIIFLTSTTNKHSRAKKEDLAMQGQNTHDHGRNMVKEELLFMEHLRVLSPSPWIDYLNRLGYCIAKNCSDCFHSFLLGQTFKNSSNISSGLIELCAISVLPVSGNSPHPPYVCKYAFCSPFLCLLFFLPLQSLCVSSYSPLTCHRWTNC